VVLVLTRILRLSSALACAIAIASFGLFAVNQTGTASAHQQRVLNGEAAAPGVAGEPNSNGEAQPGSFGVHRPGARPSHTSTDREGSVHKTIDEAFEALASPFSGITSGSNSEWSTRVIQLLLVLAVYGFGIGFLARALRVHA
jgi:hypothetical protein